MKRGPPADRLTPGRPVASRLDGGFSRRVAILALPALLAAIGSIPTAVAAQGGAGDRVDLREYGWRPHPAQASGCTWTDDPAQPAEVVDAQALLAGAAAIPGFETAESHHVVSLSFDSTGTVSDVRAIASSLEAAREVDLLDLILAHQLPQDGTRSLRLGLFGGSRNEVATGPTQHCRPYLANQQTVTRLLGQAARRARSVPRGVTVLWIFVQENGVPGEVRIHENASDPDADAIALTVAKDMRFLPARREGAPVAVWVQIPVTIVSQ